MKYLLSSLALGAIACGSSDRTSPLPKAASAGAPSIGMSTMEQKLRPKMIKPLAATAKCSASAKDEVKQVPLGSSTSLVSWGIPADVTFVKGTQAAVKLTGPTALLAHIQVEISGKQVSVSSEHCRDHIRDFVRATVTYADISQLHVAGSASATFVGDLSADRVSLTVSGSGKISAPNANLDVVALRIHGSGHIKIAGALGKIDAIISGNGSIDIAGTAESLVSEVNGSGALMAQHLKTVDAKVRVVGSGAISANSEMALDAVVTGSGKVEYYGTPSKLATRVVGSGQIRPL